MRPILHIGLAKSWRGGEQQLLYLVEELKQQGVPQHVVCLEGSVLQQRMQEAEIPVFTIKKQPLYTFRYALWLKHLCKQLGVGLVHVHDSHAHSLAFASAVLRNRTSIIVHRRVDFPISRSRLSQWKYSFPQVKRIICVSHAIRKIMAADVPRSRLVTIHSGIDLGRFAYIENQQRLRREYHVPQEKLIIGNVAAIAPHKDYFTFVRTVKLLLKQGLQAQFFIIGDGPERAAIEAFIQEQGMQQHITLTGHRPDVTHLLKELDLLLFTSKTEGLGTSLLDAFAAGAPVVATRAGGIPEVVRHEETGLLASPQDPQALARQALRMLNDPPLRLGLLQMAKQRVKAFSKEQMAQQVLAVYREVLAGK